VPQSPEGNNRDDQARHQRDAQRLEERRPVARESLPDDAQDPTLHDRDPLLRRLEAELDRDDGSPPLELPERFEEPLDEDRLLLLPLEERLLPLEDCLLLPLEERLLRPLDELAAFARPESDFELLRRERLPLLAAELRCEGLPSPSSPCEDLTSPSSIVPRHSPDASSFITT